MDDFVNETVIQMVRDGRERILQQLDQIDRFLAKVAGGNGARPAVLHSPNRELDRKMAGEKLRRMRQAAGHSQRDLAKLTGLNHATINSLEIGRSPWRSNYVDKLAVVFGDEAMHDLLS